MYQDPNRIRQKFATVYLDQYEADVITSMANYLGVSKAELVRQLVMKEAQETLGIDIGEASEVSVAAAAS